MSIWMSIDGTYALHYEGSHVDPRNAKRKPGLFPGEFGDEVSLAIVPNYAVSNNSDMIGYIDEDGYLPYLRLGLIVNNSAEGDVILNRSQVKKLKKELNRFLKDTKKKKEILTTEEKFSICDFIWDNDGNHACTLEANHDGIHTCCCKVNKGEDNGSLG